MIENPFLTDWPAPFGLPPFAAIRPEHFGPAFAAGVEENRREIDAIAARPASFAATIEGLERAGRLLAKVGAVFWNLNSSRTDDALDAIAREWAPRLAQHDMWVMQHAGLFGRVAELHAGRHALDLAPDQLRLLERTHLGFVRAGALLEPAARARMAEIAQRAATLHTDFTQNVLRDEKEWRLTLAESDLDGLPGFLRDAAAEAARERGLDGWVVTLARSSVEPFLTFSARRDLRQQAWEAWTRRGAVNTPLITELITLRHEQARLLGYAGFADYRLDDSMAKGVAAVDGLLRRVWEPAKRKAAAERDALAAVASAEGMNAPIEPWDWRHYAEKVRKARYDLDESELKPYLVLENVVQAAFDTAGRLFGVAFAERPDLPAYHPDVRVYEVTRGDETIGLFLHDNFARQGKRSGAWMSSFQVGESFDGRRLPIVVNNNNVARGTPTLLSFDDARTLFHEFGHGLHGLLTTARYPSQSGTAVLRDFVELPSQLFEHWLTAPETLRRYARHYRTGEPMPDALVDKLLAARSFNSGFATVEYTAAALLDLAFHTRPAPADPEAFEREVLAEIGMPPEIAVRHRPPHFQHLFAGAGYAAGYYAYLWAEVLDADGFAAFEETGDVFDPGLAEKLHALYAAGDTREPMELYKSFRGREPEVGALLKKRGLEG